MKQFLMFYPNWVSKPLRPQMKSLLICGGWMGFKFQDSLKHRMRYCYCLLYWLPHELLEGICIHFTFLRWYWPYAEDIMLDTGATAALCPWFSSFTWLSIQFTSTWFTLVEISCTGMTPVQGRRPHDLIHVNIRYFKITQHHVRLSTSIYNFFDRRRNYLYFYHNYHEGDINIMKIDKNNFVSI
jgi:hypothetical protein